MATLQKGNQMKTPLEWLLEKDNPSVRYFALKHLLDRSEDDPDVQAARRAIMRSEPIKKILAAQESEGYWAKSGSAYWPSYRSTAWQVLFLAELGANGRNRQVHRGCEYLLKHAQAIHGGLSMLPNAAPRGAMHFSYTSDVLEASLALCEAGYAHDPRLKNAIDLVLAKRDADGRWVMKHSFNGKMWADIETKGQPSKWVTLRALRVLKAAGRV